LRGGAAHRFVPSPPRAAQRSDPEHERLRALYAYRLQDNAPLPAFDDFAGIAASIFGTRMAAVTVLDESWLWVRGSGGLDASPLPRHDALCAHVVAGRETLVVSDLSLDARFADNPFVTGPPHLRGYAGAPLVVPGGHVLGAMCVLDTEPRSFDATDRKILESLARRVVDTMELRARTIELEQERQLLASTSEVLSMIAAGAALTDVLTTVARAMERREPEVLCSILLREGNVLRDGAGPSLPPSYRAALDGVGIGPGIGCCGEAAHTGRSAVAEDIQTDVRWSDYADLATDAGLRACWSTPILDGAGQVLGTFALYSRRPRAPRPEHWTLARQWGDLAGLAIMRTREQAQIRSAALTDALTGLPNRTALLAACASALGSASQSGPVALLFVDLDRFKMLNDSLGHAVGDEFLLAFAHRLRETAGPDNPVFRFGGDEFVVLAAGTAGEDAVMALGQRLVESGRQTVTLERRQVALSLSVGVAFATEPGQTALSLLRNADAAVYRAKDLGRDRVAVFDSALHRAAVHRLELEEMLRQGMLAGEFWLAYQPKVDLRSGDVAGVEALLRWTHPTRGNIPPGDFIAVAEDCGLIVPLGRWVLSEAVTAHAARRLADPSWQDVVLWVNLAPTQLDSTLPAVVRDVLDHAGLPACLLGLEVTEGSLMADLPAGRSILQELQGQGIQLALDDFGTGYSSLGQLKHLPVQVLKIDKSFIDGLGSQSSDQGIVVAVLALARAHGLKVVAEGVETAEQLERLIALDCDSAQGYYFARPGPLADVLKHYEIPPRTDRRHDVPRRTGVQLNLGKPFAWQGFPVTDTRSVQPNG